MNAEFYYLMNVLMLSRLGFTFNDARITKRQITALAVIQLLGLLIFKVTLSLFILIFLAAALNVLFIRWERKGEKIKQSRLLSLIVFALMFSVFSSPMIPIEFRTGLLNVLSKLGDYVILFKPVSFLGWTLFNLNLMGLLLVLNESNILIRYFFERFRLEPQRLQNADSSKEGDRQTGDLETDSRVDEREYNAGRIIGLLERVFIFVAVVNNEFSTIGFILAAKAFARFKELENRSFAEYVLIGTLVSTLIAVLAGQLTLMLAQMH